MPTGLPRARRSCLAVPGSSPRMIEKSQGLPADEVFLDLEDSVAAGAKDSARSAVVQALREGSWPGTVAVRINAATTPYAYRDVVAVVEAAGDRLDCLLLPKVASAAHLHWLDLLLTQVETSVGLPAGRIGIEAQIEDAAGLTAVDAIAVATPRLEALVFGPADFMASLGMPSLVVGGLSADYPGDPLHAVLVRILVAARAAQVQAIDGPFLQVRDVEGFRAVARRAAVLGYDGKWVLHPDQVAAANETFAPAQADYDHAEAILEAYEQATAVQLRGAVMLGEEMIDEASRKMALGVAAKGRAAGLTRTPG